MRIFQFLCVMLLFAFGILINAFAESEEPSDQTTTTIVIGEHQAAVDAAKVLATTSTMPVIVISKKQEPSCNPYILSDDYFVAPTRQLDIYRSDSNFLTTPFLPLVQRSYSKVSVKDRTSHKANVIPTRNILFPLRISMS
ncbi:hypothetical protein WAF17_02440 [Bernardetia sp. ABR2-2B]|uniref:hypothetical protein n=1 Tax=Bernardetia sp. ABR2-2B TaxID=3127472 RepID=UPI0030CBA38B